MTNKKKTFRSLLIVCLVCAPLTLNAFRPNFVNPKWRTNNSSLTSTNNDENQENFAGTKNPLRLAVLKLGLTELRYTSPLNYEKRNGNYRCANCDTLLFTSNGKYDSGSGWPSFWKSAQENSIAYNKEWDGKYSFECLYTIQLLTLLERVSLGRLEVKCKNCDGHLGHAFPDGPRRMDVEESELEDIPKDDWKTSNENNVYSRLPRYCVNGASLRFYEDSD